MLQTVETWLLVRITPFHVLYQTSHFKRNIEIQDLIVSILPQLFYVSTRPQVEYIILRCLTVLFAKDNRRGGMTDPGWRGQWHEDSQVQTDQHTLFSSWAQDQSRYDRRLDSDQSVQLQDPDWVECLTTAQDSCSVQQIGVQTTISAAHSSLQATQLDWNHTKCYLKHRKHHNDKSTRAVLLFNSKFSYNHVTAIYCTNTKSTFILLLLPAVSN